MRWECHIARGAGFLSAFVTPEDESSEKSISIVLCGGLTLAAQAHTQLADTLLQSTQRWCYFCS